MAYSERERKFTSAKNRLSLEFGAWYQVPDVDNRIPLKHSVQLNCIHVGKVEGSLCAGN